MEQIDWIQDKHSFAFFIIKQNNDSFRIKIEPKIIGMLVSHSPKIFYVELNIDNKSSIYIVDFSDLKPIVSQTKKLKIKIKSNKTEEKAIVQPKTNYYKISRGESFMERFLGINGWQAQEFAFPFAPDKQSTTEKDNNYSISTKASDSNQAPSAVKTNNNKPLSNNIRTCKNCGYIVSDDNVDYCPNCFEPLFEAEEGVDFAF